jgi:hypothetical protein
VTKRRRKLAGSESRSKIQYQDEHRKKFGCETIRTT